jgi:leucyl aminopeptidase
VRVELTGSDPLSTQAQLLVFPLTAPAELSSGARLADDRVGGALSRLVASGEADGSPGTVAVVHAGEELAAERVALAGVGPGAELDADSVRIAAAAAVRAAKGFGGILAWALDETLALPAAEQVRAAVEGALLGGHDAGRWKTSARPAAVERLVVCASDAGLEIVAARAALVAGWTNRARELVDGPPNEITPEGLAGAASALLGSLPVEVETLEPDELERLGMGGLLAVGRGSSAGPRLIVLRYRPANAVAGRRLGLVGKGVTFDSGGLFLKGQNDIVRQKADMGGAAAVVAAIGAVAELGLRLDVLGVVPAAENMLGGSAFRPGDVLTTAAGLTVEITNPDAEGRLILADALWYAGREDVTHLVDVATLTGAMRSGVGDLYSGVFANDDAWRARVVAAGEASGDHAWPWPLHRRYRSLLDSPLADLRNTAGRSFGYPVIAATFLQQFVGDVPWAHVDIYSTAFLDELRDYLGPGASGSGVRLLVELAADLAAAT